METILEFHYLDEEEKRLHKEEMEQNGWMDSGQLKENIGSIMHPEYVWFGRYCKADAIPKVF